MTDATDYLETSILNHFFRNSAVSSPSDIYVALFTSAPSEAGGGTEVSGNGYSRQAATFGAPSGGAVTLSSDVTFTALGGGWGTVTHVGVFDALTSGNLLAWEAVSVEYDIADGDDYIFQSGNLTITAD